MMLSLSQSLSVSQVDQDAVILDSASGKYFGLNPTARRIFEVLQKTGNEDEAVKTLLSEFAVEEAQLRADVTSFAELLISKGLARRLP